MMDIVTEKELNLKNITQIGTPNDRERIYIEDFVYARLHEEEYEEKRVFILMGHTTCAQGEYTIFIEEALPVQNIMFSNCTPIWTNRTWSEMFHEIRQSYEDYIIVGWAMDLKGVVPGITPELESIHREHFGGTRQLLFLLDTANQEEYFYHSKNNHLYRKNGFYIYHNTARKGRPERSVIQKTAAERREAADPKYSGERVPPDRTVHRERRTESVPQNYAGERIRMDGRRAREGYRGEAKAESNGKAEDNAAPIRGRYREMLQQQSAPKKKKEFPLGTVAVLALLVGVVGAAFYKNPEQFEKIRQLIPAVGEQAQETWNNLENNFPSTAAGEAINDSSQESEGEEPQSDTEEQGNKIPVETVDGDIPQ